MKTRKEHLQKLPLQKRLQAMENIRKTNSFQGFNCRLNAEDTGFKFLAGIFVFNNTKQGHDYWMDINNKYFSNVE